MRKNIALAAALLPAFLFCNRANAQSCSSSPTIKAGDTVSVVATLHTTDPNENGEGEPLSVQSSGGELSVAIPGYELPQTFSFVAGSANETVSGSIGGFDGDESCTLDVRVNAKHWFTDGQKKALAVAAAGFATASGAIWVVDAYCSGTIVLVPVCTLPTSLLAASTSFVSGAASLLLAVDPPDPNFTVVALPVSPTFPAVVPAQSLSQADANGLNALLTNETAIIGLLNAMITTVNRAQTASDAGDSASETLQVNALEGYKTALGIHFEAEANLRASLLLQLQSEGMPGVAITPSDVLSFESILAFQGFPSPALTMLQGLGADPIAIDAARRLVMVQDIGTVAGTFPTLFAADQTLLDLEASGTALITNRAPDCSHAVAATPTIWPANGKMVSESVAGVTDPDGDSVVVQVTGIGQDESVDDEEEDSMCRDRKRCQSGDHPNICRARGRHEDRDDDTCPDASGVGTSSVMVRAERERPGDGRVYHISFVANDGKGGTCSGSVAACVPIKKNGTCVDEGAVQQSDISCPKGHH